MQSENQEVLCPLCHGHGRDHKELLVVRWRSREFEKELQQMADEAAFRSGRTRRGLRGRTGLQQRVRLSGIAGVECEDCCAGIVLTIPCRTCFLGV